MTIDTGKLSLSCAAGIAGLLLAASSVAARAKRNPSGWGYKIDYDKAIADDETQIAVLRRQAEIRARMPRRVLEYLDPLISRGFLLSRSVVLAEMVVTLGMSAADAGAVFGLDEQTVLSVLNHYDLQLPVPRSTLENWYSVGEAAEREFDWYVHMTEAQIESGMRAAKSSLSRHRRNQKKHGPQR